MQPTQPVTATHTRNVLACVAAENSIVPLIAKAFGSVGSVSWAGTFLDAARKLNIAPFDIVFLDEHLPGPDIWGLIRLIRNGLHCSTPPVVVMACEDNSIALYQHEAKQRRVNLHPYSKLAELGAHLSSLFACETRPLVLIVDDDLRSLRLATRALIPEFELATAMDARNAWRIFQSRRFDLVILDLNLPDGSGQDLLARINNVQTAPPVIIMTGEASPRTKLDLMSLGAYNYFTKPFSLQKLRADCHLAIDSCAVVAARKSKEHLQDVHSLLVAADRRIASGQIRAGVINLRAALRRDGWAKLTPTQLTSFLKEDERDGQHEGDLPR